jgi:hypothetical protein
LGAKTPSSETFWRAEFADMDASMPLALPSANYRPSATRSLGRRMQLQNRDSSGLTSAAIKTAWSIFLAQYTDSTKLVFGVTSTGRDGTMHGVDGMSGVTIATTPFRVRICPEMTVKEMVDDAYAREIRQLPHVQVRLSAISRLGDDAAAACRFNCLLVMQPDALVKSRILSDVTDAQGLQNHSTFDTYALTLVCNQASGSVRVQAVYDDSVVSRVR